MKYFVHESVKECPFCDPHNIEALGVGCDYVFTYNRDNLCAGIKGKRCGEKE